MLMSNVDKNELIFYALEKLKVGDTQPFISLEPTGWLYDGSFRGQSFRGASLNVFMLRGKLDLGGCDLSNTTAYEVNILNSNFEDCCFDKATIEGAYLLDCIFLGASFNESTIESTLFSGDMRDTTWNNAHLDSVSFSGALKNKAHFERASFQNVVLKDVFFSDLNLRGANFTGTDLTQVTFERVVFDTTTILPDGSYWYPGAIQIVE